MGVRNVSYVRVDIPLDKTKEIAVAGLVRAHRYSDQYEGKTSLPNFAVQAKGLNWFEFVTQQAEAIAAEVAVGLYTGHPVKELDNRNGLITADVGADIEVKHTTYARGHLVIPESANDDHVAVLVVGTNPTYYLMGWMPVVMAKHPKYLHSTRTGYWVSQANLFEMKTLGRSVYGSVKI